MADKTVRTIGATVILIGIAIAGAIQLSSGSPEPSPELVAADPITDSSTEGSQTASEPTDEDTTEPFVYRIGVLAGISTDNYWRFYGSDPSAWNSYILGPTKPALMGIDPETNAVRNELIETSTEPVSNGDGWQVRATLRDDFAWSDGVPVTAHDVAFTFDTVRRLSLGGSWADAFPTTIKSIVAENEHSIVIEFGARPELAVWPHSAGMAPIMARHVWAEKTVDGDLDHLYSLSGSHDVGGGQLSLESHDENIIVSVSNPGYPLVDGPDVVEYHILDSEQSLVGALENGEVDSVVTPNGLSSKAMAPVEDEPDITIQASQANSVRYLGFNLNRAPMSSEHFRTALALVLDRGQAAEGITDIIAPSFTFTPQVNQVWYDQSSATEIVQLFDGNREQRLAKALEGLVSAGYSWTRPPAVNSDGAFEDGVGLEIDGQSPQPITILTPGSAWDPARLEYVESVADALQVLGFDARPVETDFDTVVDLAFTPDDEGELHYDMYLLGWTLGSPTFPNFYEPLFNGGGELNNTGYADPAFDELIAQYQSAYDEKTARELLWAMEAKLATDLPYLILYHQQINEAYRSDRVTFALDATLGGIQGRLGGIADVSPANER